jgi:hypothetical protein
MQQLFMLYMTEEIAGYNHTKYSAFVAYLFLSEA